MHCNSEMFAWNLFCYFHRLSKIMNFNSSEGNQILVPGITIWLHTKHAKMRCKVSDSGLTGPLLVTMLIKYD